MPCSAASGVKDMSKKLPILCVDDEPQVLEGLSMHLRKQFQVTTCTDPHEALDLISQGSCFSVILSDMRMPGMNGAAFLSKCREAIPNAVRMLLTGYSDMEAAIDAVNNGQVFRFLTKPCPPDQLRAAFEAAVVQYRLVTAEKELLETTLSGSVKMLTEVLSLAAPAAFSRAATIRAYVRHMAAGLNLEKGWVYDVASMLSQIGCIPLPPDTLSRALAGQILSDSEKKMLKDHPATGHKLLSRIPRLELCADIVGKQASAKAQWPEDPESTAEGTVAVGGAMLRVALDLDGCVTSGQLLVDALKELSNKGKYNSQLLELMHSYSARRQVDEVVKTLAVNDLGPEMVLDEDVLTSQGTPICRSGTCLTSPLIARIRNFAHGVGVKEPLRVRVATIKPE